VSEAGVLRDSVVANSALSEQDHLSNLLRVNKRTYSVH